MSPAHHLDAEALWAELLSEEPARIRKTWLGLDDDEAAAVIAHLNKMTTEPGWAEGQRESAGAALKAIRALAE